MTNEVPFDVLWKCLHLLGKFLFMALTEDALPFLVSRLDIFIGMKFADGNEANAIRQVAENFSEVSLYIIVHSNV